MSKKRPASPALDVRWHDGRLVGRVLTSGPVYFAYDEAWLTTGHDLSPLSVPFDATAFRQRAAGFDQLPGFLSDCLPDQWGRRLMDRTFNELDVKATPMRMLAWVGRRGIGALTFEPTFDEERSRSSWEAVTPILLTREAQGVLRQQPAAAFEHLRKAGIAGGALPKATVALLPDDTLLLSGDVATAAAQHSGCKLGLLKLDSEDDPMARSTDGRMEHAYMLMARAAGIRTAATQLITDPTGPRVRHHLFVERFDCDLATGRRYHLLTLAGALHAHNLTYSNLLVTTRQITADHEQVLEGARRMIFNVRSGNADDHGKNHSFLYDDAARSWTLSPAYDLTLSFTEGADYHGLFPNSFGISPRLSALAATAADAGVSAKEFESVEANVSEALRRWPEFAEAAGLDATSRDQARRVHEGLAATLAMDTPPRRSKRKKLW
jgi:serine/threonine-protein kinase HipA